MMFLRTPYNYDTDQASLESSLNCEDPSLTQQHMAEECDINTIVKRFGLTGELPSGLKQPEYGDFTGVTDYHSAMNAVLEAQRSFMQMPADIRARFNNDPGAFVEFFADEANRAEAESLGFVPAKPAKPEPAEPVDPSAT